MVSTIKFSQFANGNLNTSTNTLVGISSLTSGMNIKLGFPYVWTTANRPSSPFPGLLGYNSDLGQYEYWNGASWVQLSSGGSGTVNLGSENQLAFYSSSGTTVSGLLSGNNSVLSTNGSGVPMWSTTTPAGLTIPQPIIQGITSGSSAISGQIGQVISNTVLLGSAVSLTSAVFANVTHINLTAGAWLIFGNVFINATSGGLFNGYMWLSTISATQPDAALVSGTDQGSAVYVQIANATPCIIVNASTSTTAYLSCVSVFNSTANASGNITAIRFF
jgi:hypothetical protein